MTNERAQRLEDMAYSLGYERGKEDALKSIKTKTIKYYDDDENVWKVGEVIIDE